MAEEEHPSPDSPENTGLQAEDFFVDPKASDTEIHTDIEEEMDDDDGVKSGVSKKRPLTDESVEEGAKKAKVEVEEKVTEDVCFICHDGGELIPCDKRGCPKVYHSSCIGRKDIGEEEGTWFCGWHYCLECNKAASYHCVTCSNAYCSAHFQTADFTILKEEKLGLCSNCMPQVRVIESGDLNEAGDTELGLEDFFFREYWLEQRNKLGLSLPKPESGGRQLRSSNQAAAAPKAEQAEADPSAANKEPGADSEPAPPPVERRKFASWASPELLAFLTAEGHDVSKALRRDDVEKAVWDYISKKGLQTPGKPAEIRCDEVLEKLLRRKVVGRLAMLRILQEHFSGSITQRGASGRRLQGASAGKKTKVTLAGTKRLARSESTKKKKAAAAVPEVHDPVDGSASEASEQYAAISRRNIELLYLRRGLLEVLVDSSDFGRVVTGGFVRIRTQAIDNPSKAAYRLVPVIGVAEGPEYTFGRKTTTQLLKVQNLSKVEDTQMDTLSSQDFDEDEIARLWRATKVAEVFQPLKVSQVEAKAREILPFKVDEAMETEKQKLVNLRDRASELGEMKELKRIVEQLKALEKPETRQARLDAPLGVEADPKMDPQVVYDPEAEEKEKKEKEAKLAAEQKKAAPAPVPSPRERQEDRSSRWGGQGTGRSSEPSARDDSRTDRRKGQETPPDKRRPYERPLDRSRERSRDRDRGRRSPYRGGAQRDREMVDSRGGVDRRKDGVIERRGGERFGEKPRASRFDEAPVRGAETRPGLSPRFGGDRPRDRERGPSNERPGNGFERNGREERAPFGTGFSAGGDRGGPSPRAGLGRGFVRDARDPPLHEAPASFSARPPPHTGGFSGDPGKTRPQVVGSFDDRNRQEHGKYEAPQRFEPHQLVPPQQSAPISRTLPMHTDSYRGFGDRAPARPPFRAGQAPSIAPLPVPVAHPPTHPISVPPPAVVVAPYIPPADIKWHYRDPQGVQQGPFTLAQLRKWQSTGAFPVDLKVWMENRPESSAVLLTSLLETQATRPPSVPAPSSQVAGMYQAQVTVEPQKAATPPRRHERSDNTEFGGPSRWGPLGGARSAPQPSYGGSARPNDVTVDADGYQGGQGDVRASREGGGIIPREYAPRPIENDRLQPLSSSNFGRVNGGRGAASEYGRGQESGDRWRGNPIPRNDPVPAQLGGQSILGSAPLRDYNGRSERPHSGQGPPSGAQFRTKTNKQCMFFAQGYCMKGDTCDFVHQR